MQNSWKRQREDIFLERTETLFLHRSGIERATKRLREEREGEIQNKNSSSLHSTSLSKHTDLRNFPLPPQTCGSPAPTQSHSHPKKLSPNILSFLIFKSFISSLMKFNFSFGLTPSCYLLLHCWQTEGKGIQYYPGKCTYIFCTSLPWCFSENWFRSTGNLILI